MSVGTVLWLYNVLCLFSCCWVKTVKRLKDTQDGSWMVIGAWGWSIDC